MLFIILLLITGFLMNYIFQVFSVFLHFLLVSSYWTIGDWTSDIRLKVYTSIIIVGACFVAGSTEQLTILSILMIGFLSRFVLVDIPTMNRIILKYKETVNK